MLTLCTLKKVVGGGLTDTLWNLYIKEVVGGGGGQPTTLPSGLNGTELECSHSLISHNVGVCVGIGFGVVGRCE